MLDRTGVGTGAQESVLSPITGWVTKSVEMAIGWYLDAHVSLLSLGCYFSSSYRRTPFCRLLRPTGSSNNIGRRAIEFVRRDCKDQCNT